MGNSAKIVHAKTARATTGSDTQRVYGTDWNADHVLTGLENVDNTADADKPVSTATQAALDLKANASGDDLAPEFWLATGQSNFVHEQTYSWTPPANCHVWNNTVGSPGSVGTAFVPLSATTMAPQWAFIAARAAKYPQKIIYLLSIAKPSQPISSWMVGASTTPPLADMYADITANISLALAAAGLTKINGMLWWQAETDGINGTQASWPANFETVVSRFQAETWCPATIPWVIFGIAGRLQNATFAAADATNQYVLQAVAKLPTLRRFINTAAWPLDSYWEASPEPGHMLGKGYYEVGTVASKSFFEPFQDGLVYSTQASINKAPIDAYDAPVIYNANKAAPVAPYTNTISHLVGADGASIVALGDVFGSAYFDTVRYAGGTLASKTAGTVDTLTRGWSSVAWDGSAYAANSTLRTYLASNQSGSDHGGRMVIATTPAGSTSLSEEFFFEHDGSLGIGVHSPSGQGTVNAKKGYFINSVALPGYLAGFLTGLVLSTAGSSSTFSIAAGCAVDSTGVDFLRLASSLSKTTSSWAAGGGNGALDTGTIANNTWYHSFLIKRVDTGDVDALVSTSLTPTMPANYTLSRRNGSMLTDGSAKWVKFIQDGDLFVWDTPFADFSPVNNPGTSANLRALTVPPGVNVLANIITRATTTSTAVFIRYSDPAISDLAADGGNSQIVSVSTIAPLANIQVRTNTSRQVRARLSFSDSNTNQYIITTGYVDARGRNG